MDALLHPSALAMLLMGWTVRHRRSTKPLLNSKTFVWQSLGFSPQFAQVLIQRAFVDSFPYSRHVLVLLLTHSILFNLYKSEIESDEIGNNICSRRCLKIKLQRRWCWKMKINAMYKHIVRVHSYFWRSKLEISFRFEYLRSFISHSTLHIFLYFYRGAIETPDDSYFRSKLRLWLCDAMVLSALGLRLTFSRDENEEFPGALRL